MAKNPLFSNKVSPNGATAPENPLNDSYKRYKRGYNKFDLHQKVYTTERYADINVIDVLEGVEGDKLPLGNKHFIRSYTLNSPIMFDIYKKKSYFMVDNKAILPNNWEKVYKQPNKGDDVDDGVNCFTENFLYYFYYVLGNLTPTVSSASFVNVNTPDEHLYSQNSLNYWFRFLLLLESVFSNGSLLSNLGCNLSSMIRVMPDTGSLSNADSGKTFDEWLEETLSFFKGESFDVSSPDTLYVNFPQLSTKRFTNNVLDSVSDTYIYVTPRVLFDYMRTFPDFIVFNSGSEYYKALIDHIIHRVSLLKMRFDNTGLNNSSDSTVFGLNFSRLVAYQLVATQFYTRDSVDNVYNAELFMQNAKEVANEALNTTIGQRWPWFSYNGVKTDYDVFSGRIIADVSLMISDYWFGNININPSRRFNFDMFAAAYNYFHMLLFFRKSLRYGDYFTGAKTRPLAVGDVSIEVNDNSVSAIDVTRNILVQRFLNSVNRVSNTWKDYLSGVTDGVAAPKDTEPRFLASSTSSVNGFEVENTAENQGNIVTLLKSGNSNYVYEVEVGSPCIIIGVSTYEVPRVYSRTVSRFFKHANRFDMFNKFMQNIGDQEITMNERSAAFSPARIFGYTPRHMEYKQRYPVARGGFVDGLKGYAFITDNKESNQNDLDFSDTALKITPFYIRSRNNEFDRFYSSLTGLSLANYFHFIVTYDNYCNASRQMEYSPSIL